MKVFTFFYNRFETATTSKALYENGIKHTVLMHHRSDYEKFKKNDTIFGTPEVTNFPRGLAHQRNAALDLMNMNEWAVFMCDDFKWVNMYSKKVVLSDRKKMPIEYHNQSRFDIRLKRNRKTLKDMFELFPKLIELADKNNIKLVGFGLNGNPLSCVNKFTTRGLADGRFWLVKKSTYSFDLNAQLADDVAWTAENLCRNGNNLILNWCLPVFERYSEGGFGSIEDRLEMRRKECAYLVNKYSPLVKIAKKANWEHGTHIKIIGSDGNIKKAREKLGY